MVLSQKSIAGGIVIGIDTDRIDMIASRDFRTELSKQIADKPRLVILDFTNVNYLDSSALGTLLTIMKEVRGYGGNMRIASLNESLQHLFRLTKLDKMFDIFDTVEGAQKA